MVQTRRSFIRLLGSAAALAPCLGGPASAGTGAAATAAEEAGGDLASLVRLAALSSPAQDGRARAAVEGTLARLQGLAVDHTRGRFILANIAAAEVVAYQDGREVLRSRVIVGAGRTRTPQLASVVPSVRLNPPWYVPASIEPTVRASAGGFRRVGGRLVQPPGPRNPLGPVRIGLENSDGGSCTARAARACSPAKAAPCPTAASASSASWTSRLGCSTCRRTRSGPPWPRAGPAN